MRERTSVKNYPSCYTIVNIFDLYPHLNKDLPIAQHLLNRLQP